jgi:two-component system chemotaxis response regulator CheY
MRALIVDDSRFVREFLRGLLEKNGFECADAPDGQAALDFLNTSPPFDLALVDWNMPHMGGRELVRRLRACGFSGLKVMVVSTEGGNDCIVCALDAGADEYLMKPFDEEALTEKLALIGLVED